MGSQWSFAAALHAKGRGLETYGDRLEQAEYGAKLLEVELPVFPVGDFQGDRLAETTDFLLNKAGPQVTVGLSQRHGPRQAALAELAIKTHGLLLTYSPRKARLASMTENIRRVAEGSQLPEEIWRDLIDLLEDRAAFSAVKSAVFQLHKRALAHLSAVALE